MAKSVFFPSRPVEYTFSNSTQVTVNHNLGYIPTVQILLDNGSVVHADVQHTSTNSLVVTFVNAKTGSVIIR